MHKRHDCGDNGKFLQFESKNSIRAGKRSHADAVHSVYKWKNFIGNPKIASITTPNLVASGQFKHRINIEKLKQLPTANYSKKFPGKYFILSRTPSHLNPQKSLTIIVYFTNTIFSHTFTGISVEAIKGVTPEIYPSNTRPEKFIIPGIKSDTELNQVLKILDTIAEM